MVRFTQDQYNGSEAVQSVIITLELVGGTFPDTFNVTVIASEKSPVSAEGNCVMCMIMCSLKVWLTGGVDFNPTPLTATFASGMTMSNVSVPVNNDSFLEGPEEFNLTLDVPSSLGPAVTAGDRVRATGVIIDSSSKYDRLRRILRCKKVGITSYD